ncbi:MAG: hypothetical protein WEB78_02920 [Ilumatobacteraceae bacterium]
MSHHRQLRRRAHRHPVRIEFEHDPFGIWLPPVDDPIVIATFAHAASIAFDVLETGAEREVLVLLDERRHVTALLLDPPPPVGVLIGSCELPCLEVPFCQTLSIVVEARIVDGPPSDDDRLGYQSLRRLHMLQGLQLLDVILTDEERIQSLAIACDPDPIWFEPFEPFEPVDMA